MSASLDLSSAVHVFPCPICKETINTKMHQCPFCAAPIDPNVAEQAATETSKISQACSDASYLKIMLGVYAIFVLGVLIPFLGLVGLVGARFLSFAIPFMCIRWWLKYYAIRTNDSDFSRAKRTAIWVSIAAPFILFAIGLGVQIR